MNRRFGFAVLAVAGILVGFAAGTYQKTEAQAPVIAAAATLEARDDSLDELKEIKTQLKEINTLLHSGTIKVVVVLNPDSK